MATDQETASSSSTGATQDNASDGTKSLKRKRDDSDDSTSPEPGAAEKAFLKVQEDAFKALPEDEKLTVMMSHPERRSHKKTLRSEYRPSNGTPQ